jgi:hypothetical protein
VLAVLEGLAQTQPALARAFDADWQTPLRAWSTSLWADPPAGAGFEPPFREALVAELSARPDLDAARAAQLVSDIERTGAVLTPHHVCPTNGPTFGATDHIATLSAPGPALVMAWSGVPMSNTAASGALCFSRSEYAALLKAGPELTRQRQAAKDRERDGVTERRVVLVPPELRDALVYGCPMPPRSAEVRAHATDALRALLPEPAPEESYAGWALRVCEGLQRRMLGRQDLWYVDLNRVAARYLCEVLLDTDHPVSRLLQMREPPSEGALATMSWFYTRRPGKRESVETRFGGGDLAALREGLQSGALCPGMVPVFGALRLCSRMRLLGGFRQVGYLEEIAQAWREAGVIAEDRGVPGRLVTGRLTGRDGGTLYPLDLVLGAARPEELPSGEAPMSVLWTPLLPRLKTP